MRRIASIVVVTALLGGCATAPPPTAPPARLGLIGTEWTLVAFQSPEDSIGTIKPEPGEIYTLRLNPDGTVEAGIFCNRGSGHWSSPDAAADRGSISFAPMAVTRMACLQPARLERIESDFERVRSFVIEGGRLHLNLAIDSGDYIWEPAR